MIGNSILYIRNGDETLLFDGKRFNAAPATKIASYYSVAALPLSLIRTHGFKTPRETSSEKLAIQAEISMYEEGGLNPDTDFKIDSLTIPLEHEETLYVESYAVEVERIRHQFDTFVKKSGHLDAIISPALSYQALYAFEHLDAKNDIFIHFGEHSAYAVIFKNGHYIATRSITNLEDLAQKLGLGVGEVRQLLRTKGIENDRYTPDEFLQMHTIQEELSKAVERIAHSISHKRGIFGLDHIERFFIDFEGDTIPGFLEMFESYGYEASSKEILNIFDDVEPGNKHHALNALYALGGFMQKYPMPNLSIYERKPSFFKTHVGQFSLLIATAVLLAVAYPVYANLELERLNTQHQSLQQQVSSMETMTQKLRHALKEERRKRNMLKDQYHTLVKTVEGYDHMLDALIDFDTEKLARQRMMKDINMAMRQYMLSSKYLEQNGSESMKAHIITPYTKRDNIAKFMKQLIQQGYTHVETKKIERDNTLYESLVEIRP